MSSSPADTDDSKRNSLELESEHAQRVQGAEPGQAPPTRLKERQKFFEEAFQQDMEHYLSTGYLQVAERREPIGSMSSMEVNVDLLEQMDLMDMSDHEALDVFLTSGGEETTALSPGMGPDGEVSLLVPSPPGRGPAPHHGDHDDPPCTVVVTLDDEDVHPDTALVDATPSPGSPGNQTRKD